MRKLITLSRDQEALAKRLMGDTYQTSLSKLLVFLMADYRLKKRHGS